MFPHQREEPDAALADAEVGRGEGEGGVERRLGLFRVVFGRPAEGFPLPRFAARMQLVGQGADIGQVGNQDWDECCLLYTSDAADERSSVDLGGRRIINKKKKVQI